MSNPLYNHYANKQRNSNGNIFQRFSEFRKMFSNDGAQAKIQEMLNSGELSQQDYNNAVQKANQFASMFNLR